MHFHTIPGYFSQSRCVGTATLEEDQLCLAMMKLLLGRWHILKAISAGLFAFFLKQDYVNAETDFAAVTISPATIMTPTRRHFFSDESI
mmetsp:Transcript_824/g.1704  ORF Transcript_824/g.1704 Transcript_824/m.1704 type:complete len:89 (+) Transcript_824:1294-1560(+)